MAGPGFYLTERCGAWLCQRKGLALLEKSLEFSVPRLSPPPPGSASADGFNKQVKNKCWVSRNIGFWRKKRYNKKRILAFSKMEGTSHESKTTVEFDDLGLDEWLIKQCKQMGLSKPTEIQQNCVPHILKGDQFLNRHMFSRSVNIVLCSACLKC